MTAPKKASAPSWLRSRASRRSLGSVNLGFLDAVLLSSLLSFVSMADDPLPGEEVGVDFGAADDSTCKNTRGGNGLVPGSSVILNTAGAEWYTRIL